MKHIYTIVLCLLGFLLQNYGAHASVIDSLENILRFQKEDTSKVNLLLILCEKTGKFNDREKYVLQAEELSTKLSQSPNVELSRKGNQSLAEAYYLHAWIYRQRGDNASRVEYCRKALVLYQRLGDSVFIARAHNNVGTALTSIGSYDEANQHFTEALRISRLCKNANQSAVAYQRLGELSKAQARNGAALQYFEQALQLRGEAITQALAKRNDSLVVENKRQKTDIYNAICDMYRNVEDYDKALDYTQQSMTIHAEVRDSARLFSTILDVGDIYYSKKNYDSALTYFNRAMLLAEIGNDIWAISTICERQGFVYLSLKNYPTALRLQLRGLQLAIEIGDIKGIADSYDDIAIIYLEMGSEKPQYFDSAEVYVRKALHEYSQIRNESSVAQEHIMLSKIYEHRKMYAVQKQHLLQALKTFSKQANKQKIWECYYRLASCDSSLGNLKEAFFYLRLTMNYQDSLNLEKNDMDFKRVQFHNDIQKVQGDLAKQQEQKDAASQLELDKQKTMRNGFIGDLWYCCSFQVSSIGSAIK
ncbi:MAG: tetratricopeptide repeat protein [Ignavibacteria bacterium]|nr:tetratricopeptide repeat protein [Ignavibacteria bacterium]